MTAAEANRARLDADIAAVAAGDRVAMHRVYDATSARLFGICLAIAGSREGAEDALQETYAKVWRRASSFDRTRAGAMTWLALIARATAIDARRVAMRQAEGLDALATREPTPGLDADEAGALSECLGELPDEQRDPIRSAYFDGYSYAELALRRDVPLGTMKSRIRRGLLALRRCLDDA